MERRTFMKVGIIGGAVLGAAGLASRNVFWGPGTHKGQAAGRRLDFITRKDYTMLAAIVPVILGDALPRESRDQLIDETIATMDSAIAHFQVSVQDEVRQLFALLELAPTRMAAARVWSSWENASPQAISAFLNRWQYSGNGLLQSGYDALQQLTMGSWYGNPKSWQALGYPGPPVFQTAEGGR